MLLNSTIFLDVDSVTKPIKANWRGSNSVVDMINPRHRMTSHVHLHDNNVDNGSPIIVVGLHVPFLAD